MGTSDRVVLKQVFLDQEYAPVAHIPRVNTIVDCGANIGLTSMYLLECYPNARLLAIEADARNAEICRRNLRPHGDHASVVTAAIWSRGNWYSTVPLILDHTFGDGREWATTVKEAPSHVAPDVPGIGLQAVCDRVGDIDLLKVDIEGCEAVMFATNHEKWLPRVRNMAIELHGRECSEIFFRCTRRLHL
jgi:FkbM family methyltransferase